VSIDRGVDVVVTDPSLGVVYDVAATMGTPAAAGWDTPEFLDVDVHELAGPVGVDTTDHASGRPVLPCEPVQAVANGNVRGGVRSPHVDAPIGALGGAGNGGTGPVGKFCGLFGTTAPFSASKLASLCNNHSQFVTRWDQAAQQAVEDGILRQSDAVELEYAALASHIGT
jgi:Alpha/beta hydrolase domain